MNWETIITYTIINIAVFAAIAYLARGASKNVDRNAEGQFVLRLSRLYQILGIILLAFCSIFIFAGIYYQEKDLLLISFLMFLTIGILSLACLLWYYNHQVIFDEKTISASTWTKKITSMQWDEIESIKFSPMSGYIKIKSLDKTIKLSSHLIGLKEFIKIMEKQTKWTAKKIKFPIK